MKNYLILGLVSSILLVPSLFAETATGTTATGTTATGTTATGTTATGTQCITGSGVNTILLAQEAFSIELTRLVNEKKAAYQVAQSLTGTLKLDALKAANEKFRLGFKNAIKTLELAKKANKSDFFTKKMECKKERKDEKKEYKKQKHQNKNEIKHEIKELKKAIKEIKKAYKSNHKNR